MPCQAVFNKMSLDPIPDELKDLKKSEKILISKRIIFKKIAIMHGKWEFAKIKGSTCNIPIEAANICNILPSLADSNGLIVVKLKQDLNPLHSVPRQVRDFAVIKISHSWTGLGNHYGHF